MWWSRTGCSGAALEACPLATRHDADADTRLGAATDPEAPDPRRWRYVVLVDGRPTVHSEHDGLTAAAASVAAQHGLDRDGTRWAEPVSAGER